MSHDAIRLETTDGTVISYFAPSFEFEPSWNNDVTENPVPGNNSLPLILDLNEWTAEITVQGTFEDSTNLPQEHRQALLSLDDWTEPITAQQQVDRLTDMVVYGGSAPYHLYVEGREFTATSPSQVDPANGVYPAVSVTEIRTPQEAGLNRDEYLVRFAIGNVES